MTRQSGRTRHKNVDANQADIVRDLRAAGVTVVIVGPLDLLCTYGGVWIFIEIKDLTAKPSGDRIGVKATQPGGGWHDVELLFPGRAKHIRPTQAQFIRDFHEGGTIAVVYDSAEALMACGVTT